MNRTCVKRRLAVRRSEASVMLTFMVRLGTGLYLQGEKITRRSTAKAVTVILPAVF